jgi:WD40 repeat protein
MAKYYHIGDPLKSVDSYSGQQGTPRPESKTADGNGVAVDDSYYPHKSSILALCPIRGSVDCVHDFSEYRHYYSNASRYITGDREGNICVWMLVEGSAGSLMLVLMKHFTVSQFISEYELKPAALVIKSISERDKLILIGNNCSEIFEIHEDSIGFVPNFQLDESNSMMSTHPLVLSTIHESKEQSINGNDDINKGLKVETEFKLGLSEITGKAKRVADGHSSGEIWGLAIHPYEQVCFTAGDDHILKCWNLSTNRILSFAHLPHKARSLAIQPVDGTELAVALNSGHIIIVSVKRFFGLGDRPKIDPAMTNFNTGLTTKHLLDELEALQSKPEELKKLTFVADDAAETAKVLTIHPTQWVQKLKYSINGSILAAGSHDSKIYVYAVGEKDASKRYEFLYTVNLHSSFVTHLDFGVSLPSAALIAGPAAELLKDDIDATFIGERYTDLSFDSHSNKIITEKRTFARKSGEKDSPIEMKIEQIKRDLTVSDFVVQSTSGSGELFFWKCVDGSNIKSPNDVKDVYWLSFTCPYGWPIQGIYSPDDSLATTSSIFSVARSHTYDQVPVLAVADIYGRLRLFNYPCVSYGSPDKCYKAHSGKITNIEFSASDEYLVSTGGNDRCVMIWKTDIEDEIRSRKAFSVIGSTNKSHVSSVIASSSPFNISTASSPSLLPTGSPVFEEAPSYEESLDHILKNVGSSAIDSFAPVSGGDEFQAIKPWKSVIREPSSYHVDPEIVSSKNGKLPKALLELKYAYGYRGYDCRNNLFYGSHLDEIVYFTASLGIVHHTKGNRQLFNNEHTGNVISVAVHPDGNTVATGEIAKFPKIVLWDIHTGTTIKALSCHKVGISQLSFHPSDPSILISCGLDDDRMLMVHNISNGTLIGKSKIGKGIAVHSLRACPYGNMSFLTAGKNHLKFWDLPSSTASPGGELSSKTGIYNLKSVTCRTVLSCAYLGIDPITGMEDGSLLLWKDRTNTRSVGNAHHGAITAMASIMSNYNLPASGSSAASSSTGGGSNVGGSNAAPKRAVDGRDDGPRVVTGSKDGLICIWDIQLNCVWTLNLNDTMTASNVISNHQQIEPFNNSKAILTPCFSQVQSLDVKDNTLLIGTKSSEIFEISIIGSSNVNSINSSVTNNSFFCRVKCHFQERSELWGLAVHPKQSSYFVTASDDMTVRLWDGKNHEIMNIVNIQSKSRCIQYSPDGNHIAVGTSDGKVIILSDDLKRILFNVLISSSWIHTMAYSPNGQQLAVGCHDSMIYLLETKSYSCRFKCKGHHSFITAIDYSKDSNYLQTTSGDYELLYWNSANGQQVMNINITRDILWSTLTCPFGWSVQGIWPKSADGTDVNSVDRSPVLSSSSTSSSAISQQQKNQQLLITGDDNCAVKLFSYPVLKENQVHHAYKGHSHHVMNVKFSCDGKYVYSVGGMDKTVLQFEVKYG